MRETSPAKLSHQGRLKYLFKDTLLYGGAGAISRAFGLITFPLLVRHFSVNEYGIIDYYYVLINFLGVLLIFGQDSSVARFFYEYSEISEKRIVISQSLMYQLILYVVLLPLFMFSIGWQKQILINHSQSELMFKLVLVQLPFTLLVSFSQNILKWTFKRKEYLIISLGATVFQAIFVTIAVLYINVDFIGIIMVSIITSIVFGIVGIYYIKEWITYPFSNGIKGEIIRYAIPYGIICVAGAFSPIMERTIINNMLGMKELGFYAAAVKIAMLISLIINAFQTAWGPFSLSLYKQSDAAYTYNLVLKAFLLVMTMSALIITMLTHSMIHYLATDKYADAEAVVFPLIIGLVVQSISWITEIGISISKKSYLSLYSYIAGIISSILSIWLLASTYGLFGVGLGVMIGQIVKSLVSSLLAQMAYRLPWNYKPVIWLISVTIIMGMTSIWLGKEIGVYVKNIGLMISIVMISLIGWKKILESNERKKIYDYLADKIIKK